MRSTWLSTPLGGRTTATWRREICSARRCRRCSWLATHWNAATRPPDRVGCTGRSVCSTTRPEGAAHGYPLYFRIFAAMTAGDLEAAISLADEMGKIGRRFDDPSLVALALIGRGRALVKRRFGGGRDGAARRRHARRPFREAPSGVDGCRLLHLMDACAELDELRRAGEWTHAASRWCEGIPPAGSTGGSAASTVRRSCTPAVRGRRRSVKQHRRVRTWPTSTSGRSPRVTTRSVRSGGCAAI